MEDGDTWKVFVGQAWEGLHITFSHILWSRTQYYYDHNLLARGLGNTVPWQEATSLTILYCERGACMMSHWLSLAAKCRIR